MEASIILTLEEAYQGTEKEVHVPGSGNVRFRVPPGALPGKRLRLAGKGQASSYGGPRGDVFLHIEIAPHRLYRLEGKDIHLDTPIAPWEAALGATLLVPTLAGDVRLKVPAGTRGGQKLRLTGKGMPSPKGNGDFFVNLQVAVPGNLTEDEKELYARLAAISDFDPRPGFPKA